MSSVPPVEGPVGSVMVVAVEEPVERIGALGVVIVGPRPRPLVLEREVEPFDLAVGLGPVGPGLLQPHPRSGGRRGEVAGAVARAVEFLTVVKGGGGGHAAGGTSGVSERLATPFLTRSSRRVALRALAIVRRASRISAGMW